MRMGKEAKGSFGTIKSFLATCPHSGDNMSECIGHRVGSLLLFSKTSDSWANCLEELRKVLLYVTFIFVDITYHKTYERSLSYRYSSSDDGTFGLCHSC